MKSKKINKFIPVAILTLTIGANINPTTYADESYENVSTQDSSSQTLEYIAHQLENLNRCWDEVIRCYQYLLQERAAFEKTPEYKLDEEMYYKNTLEELRKKIEYWNEKKLYVQQKIGESFEEFNCSKLNLNWDTLEQEWDKIEQRKLIQDQALQVQLQYQQAQPEQQRIAQEEQSLCQYPQQDQLEEQQNTVQEQHQYQEAPLVQQQLSPKQTADKHYGEIRNLLQSFQDRLYDIIRYMSETHIKCNENMEYLSKTFLENLLATNKKIKNLEHTLSRYDDMLSRHIITCMNELCGNIEKWYNSTIGNIAIPGSDYRIMKSSELLSVVNTIIDNLKTLQGILGN